MCLTKNCYEICINKEFMLSEKMLKHVEKILAELKIKAKVGRPLNDLKRAINGIYYILKTGAQWRALPRCFGSYSSVHKIFSKLCKKGFFKLLWHQELRLYDIKQGLRLDTQAADCTHIKSPLGKEATGPSPVDRRKLATKRSILTDANGIIIGCAISSGNRHDSQLLEETLQSMPNIARYHYRKTLSLDAAYDSEKVRLLLIDYFYEGKIIKNPRPKKNVAVKFPLGYDRWFVERTHSWLNRCRRLFVRYEKYALYYLSLIHFAAAIITFNKI